jgi:hypothetical protein
MGDQIEISAFGVTIYLGIKNVEPKKYMTQKWEEYSGYRNTTCHFLFSPLRRTYNVDLTVHGFVT